MDRRIAVASDRVTGRVPGMRTEDTELLGWWGPVGWLGIHVVLGLVMVRSPAIATLHALVAAGIGLVVATRGKATYATYAIAYLIGSDVLWRMTDARVWWEMGKYCVAAVSVMGLLRLPRIRWQLWALLYFALLLPSIVVSPYDVLAFEGRRQLSFNLSGPFCLVTSVVFLSHAQLSSRDWVRALLALVGPLVAMTGIALHETLTATDLVFTLESNATTSGGFGPNQVSAVIGLGALLCFLSGIAFPLRLPVKLLLLGVSLVFMVYSAMTFSRGGLYGAAGALILASPYFLRRKRERLGLATGVVLLTVIVSQVILPRLDEFTSGMLSERFHSTNTTGRSDLMLEDLEMWSRFPVLGVGPGGAEALRFNGQPAHTEFSRMLAEHGVLGLLSLASLLALGAKAVRSASTPAAKGFALALVAWSVITMAHSAMRTAAPGAAVGLAFTLLTVGSVAKRPGAGIAWDRSRSW